MKALALGLALASYQPEAHLSIFVPYEPGKAWWLAKGVKARPTGKELGSISISALNSFLRKRYPASQPFCHLDQVERSSFVGADGATRLEIENSFKQEPHDPFRLEFSTSDGRKFIARVGLAEYCKTGTVRSIVVIQDASNSRIESLEDSGGLFAFLWRPKDGVLINYSNCLECDFYDVLFYDVKSRKFTWEGE
jgi:hypothetical protein